MVATTAEGIISTSDLPVYVLDGLFGSFGEETIWVDDIQNYELAVRLTVTAGEFLIDIRMPVMITFTE